MALTSEQLTTLAADILADPVLNAFPQTPDGADAIAKLYNLNATPDFYVWKTSVSTDEVRKSIVWLEYLASSVSEKSAFELMLSNGVIDPSDVNVRDGIEKIFGNQNQQTTRDNLISLSKRLATRVEKLFAVGTGTVPTPATMGFEGKLTYQDVDSARSL